MKRLKILRLMVAGVATLFSVVSTPVFADDYGGRLIVPQTNNVPQFFIRRIDMTHNQLEFAYAKSFAGNKTIAKIGAGWVDDCSESLVNADVRAYNLGDPGIQTVFWSDNEVIEDFASADIGYFKTYTVDAAVDLKSNNYYELFYIVEFTNGEVWMNKASYRSCSGWIEGKSCDKAYYTNDKELDNVVYQLADAPATKFQRRYTTPAVTEPEPDTEPEPEPTSEPDPTPTSEPDSEPIQTQEPVSKPSSETAGIDEKPELIAKVASTVRYSTDITATDTTATSDIEEETEGDEDEITEANEGYGDTTLDVPALGQTAKKCDDFNFWPYIILGFGGGVFLSLVLSYIKKAKNVLSTIR